MYRVALGTTFVAWTVMAAGCARVQDGVGPDAIFDPSTDTYTQADLPLDAPVDPFTETYGDAMPDTIHDPEPDTVADGIADTAPDTIADTAPDTIADTVLDTSSDTAIDPTGCAAAVAAFDHDFDSPASCAAWTHGVWSGAGCGTFDSWECGAVPGWPDDPPGSTGSLGTDLDGWPDNDECSYIDSPAVDLSACAGQTLWLDFKVAYSLEVVGSSCHDGGFVAVNDSDTASTSWVVVEGYYDHPCSGCHHLAGEYAWCALERGWHDVSVNVSAYARPAFQVRFAIEYDGGYPWNGLFVDDVRLRLGP